MLDTIVFKMLCLIYNVSVHFHLFSHSRMFQINPFFRNKLSTYSSISMWTVDENAACLHFHTKTQDRVILNVKIIEVQI